MAKSFEEMRDAAKAQRSLDPKYILGTTRLSNIETVNDLLEILEVFTGMGPWGTMGLARAQELANRYKDKE